MTTTVTNGNDRLQMKNCAPPPLEKLLVNIEIIRNKNCKLLKVKCEVFFIVLYKQGRIQGVEPVTSYPILR